MAATKLIAMHINKGKTLAQCLKARTDYAMDPKKTENGELVTSYECDPMTAAEEFLLSKRQYEQNVRRPYKNDVIAFLQEAGYEYKPGKQPALRGKGQRRFIRFCSLGEGYSVEELSAVITGAASHKSCLQDRTKASAGSVQPHRRPDISFLIDIQEKMQQGKGAGYIQWAQVFNAKQKAKALMFMHEHGITSYEELAEKAAGSQERCDELLSSIRDDETRLKEIAAIREHLLDFSKAKNTFDAYKRSGYSQEFFEKNREVLSRRRAAKKAFDEYEKVHGSLPKIRDLNTEYSALITRKKKNYAEYYKLKPQMQEWQIAHRIVQDILKEPEAQSREEERQAETQKDKSNR